MRNNISRSSLLAMFLAANGLSAASDSSQNTWLQPDPRALTRWEDMRFGMFIHWGPVSLTGQEIGWSRGSQTSIEVYDNLYKQFNPTNFDADKWVSIAKAAGMKYVVLTTKHHDGFCLWDTKQTDYNIMNSPFKRDVVKELAAACKKQGIAFGAYYSVCDWHHPDFPLISPGGTVRRAKSDLDAYNRYLLAQISELITNYGPLVTIWNDAPQEFSGRGVNTIKLVRQLQPDILINNRTGDGGDYDTPEQTIGAYQDQRPWETCMTICNQWSWKPDDKMKSLKQCLQTLVLCAGGDGNLLFNVGPMPDGRIEPRQVERLKAMGAWLDQYGDTIYRTRGGPWKPTKTLASTRRDKSIFLHVLKWDGDCVKVPEIPAKVLRARVLTGGRARVIQNETNVLIKWLPPLPRLAARGAEALLTTSSPAEVRDGIDTIIELDLDRSAMNLQSVRIPSLIKATASNVYQNVPEFDAESAFDDNPNTRWATDFGTKQAWVALEFPQPTRIGAVSIREALAPRVKKFEFQYRGDADWRTLFSGTELGGSFNRSFESVNARAVRLNILDAVEGPTIWEIKASEK